MSEIPAWRLRGEFVVSCSCDWCPCAISLGRARPTEGHCYTWFAFRLDEGRAGEIELGGLHLALLIEVPGRMAEGNYALGLFLDARGSEAQREPLERIFTGRAGGPPGWWSLVVGQYLGAQVVTIGYESEGARRRVSIPKVLEGVIEAEIGADKASPVRLSNTPYWMGREVALARGVRSRVRGWGRNWELSGRAAEFGTFDWQGP
ncbi:MAG: DUF1326 domain-containing protein [Candidatus Rokubacteria bacterium]|nr:DUF1326 domain-containing protein [Candidatus Rokubacteria bacterium]